MHVDRLRAGIASSLVCLSLLALAACDGNSQLVVGVVTNLPVSDQLSTVRLEAYRNGVLVDQQSWTISDTTGRDFVLPGSFNYYSEKGGTPVVEIKLQGFLGSSPSPIVERTSQV